MNVRWDAVVGSNRFWTESPRPAAPARTADKENAAPVTVKVWLYGSLASLSAERPLLLQLPGDFTVGEVLAELVQRYGEGFSDQVIGAGGRKLRHCRVFVDGHPADDPDAPVHADSSPALVEIILLTAIEGG